MTSAASANFRRSPDSEMIRLSADGTHHYQEVKMTTPQSILYELNYKFGELNRFIQGDEDGEGIIGRVAELEVQNHDMLILLQKIEDQLRLIVKLLGK